MTATTLELSSDNRRITVWRDGPPPRILWLKGILFECYDYDLSIVYLYRPSPEYLVRTGSMKNKVIPSSSSTLPSKAQEREDCRKKKGRQSNNYAFYNIQSGCFTWQGR